MIDLDNSIIVALVSAGSALVGSSAGGFFSNRATVKQLSAEKSARYTTKRFLRIPSFWLLIMTSH